jgi:cytochrome P450
MMLDSLCWKAWLLWLALCVSSTCAFVVAPSVFLRTAVTTDRASPSSSRRLAAASSSAANATIDAASSLFQADSSVEAPIPPAYTKCPFSGILGGPDSFYRTASKELQGAKIFSFSLKGQPMVEVSGGKAVRKVFSQEFSSLVSNAVAGISQRICGPNCSLRMARDKSDHQVLRNLIGAPLTPSMVASAVPTLQEICQDSIHGILKKTEDPERIISAADLTQSMALDVTWKQILGLDFTTPAEIRTFHEQTHIWLRGMYSPAGSPEMEATLQAREYLVKAIEDKIQAVLKKGKSDGSTVGGLVFAALDDNGDDNEQSDRTLSKEEVVDNVLLLILAGTEVTSSTIANAMLLLGLHPDAWNKVVKEQEVLVQEHGEALSKDLLDNNCPYLEAVIHETMRLLPVTLVSRREAKETMLVEGVQIPQGWGVSYNIYLTHQHAIQDEPDHMDLLKGFQPDRWLPNSSKTRPAAVDYIPFGAGPRHCPGETLAWVEMKAFLALVARQVDYSLVMKESNNSFDQDLPLDGQIPWRKLNAVPMPQDGVQIRAHART